MDLIGQRRGYRPPLILMLARNPHLAALIGFAIMFAISMSVKTYVEFVQERSVDRQIEFSGSHFELFMSHHVQDKLKMLDQLRLRKEHGEIQDNVSFLAAAAIVQAKFPEFFGINLIDRDRKIVAVYPFESNASALGQHVGQSPQIAAILDEAVRTRSPKATPPAPLFQGGTGIASYFPIFVDGQFSGFVNGVFRAEQLFDHVLAGLEKSLFAVEILDGSDVVFGRASDKSLSGRTTEHQVKFADRVWLVKLTASIEFPGVLEIGNEKAISMVMFIFSSLLVGALSFAIALSYGSLIQSRRRFGDFAAASSDWFWEQDDQLRFTYVSTGNTAISGISPDAHYGKTRQETEPLDVSSERWKIHDETLAARRPLVDFEFSHIDSNGTRRSLSISGRPYYSDDGRFCGYRGTGKDITDRKKADSIIRLMSAIVHQCPASVVVTDPSGVITYVNPAFSEATGYSLEEVLGKNPRILQSGKTEPEVYRDLWSTLTQGKTWRGEFLNKTKSGILFWELAAVAPIKDDSGVVTHYVAIKENVTFRKDLETELTKAKDNAVAANLAKSKFLAMMSHELRTPLNAVIGFAELLHKQSFGELGDSRYVDYAADIENSGRHLLELLNDVLDLAKIETGAYPLDIRAYKLGALVKDLAAVMLSMAKTADHALAFRIDDEVRVLCDRRATRQILLNLVSNAVKYTERGGQVAISVAAESQGSAKLTVEDNGVGMSMESVGRATEMFERLDNRMGSKPEGVGIGLYMVKQLADKMGATLDIRSKLGRGTSVTVTFKTTQAESLVA